MRRRGASLLLALAWTGGMLLPAVPAAVRAAPSTSTTTEPAAVEAAPLPAGFVDEAVYTGLDNPTRIEFSPDGRVFVAEKSGIIKVYPSLTSTTPTIFADLRTNVYNFWDRGLLGMALAPNFPTDPSVYVLYTFDAAIGGTAPRWGSAGVTSDGCPSPPGATGDGCVVSGRLSRLTASGSQSTGETVLINDWCQQYPSHSIGDIAFGPDGALYASGGDGASFNFADYGQDGNPLNPCGDPPTGVGGTQTPPTAEGGALRSQDLRTSGDPVSLDGTIIRIDPATGNGIPGNPLYGSADANARRVIAYGLRNPFRITFRPGTSELWIGDVGWNIWEEVDRMTTTTPSSPVNFGWPCYEGSPRQSAYDGLDLSICENLYASPGAVQAPFFSYNHSLDIAPPDDCPPAAPPSPVSSSITGLAFYQGSAFPASYQGALFGADYSRNCIWVMQAGANGVPDPGTISAFQPAAQQPVNLKLGPDGALYYANLGGQIRRIRWVAANQPPTADLVASPLVGPAPLNVSFDARGSTDPEGQPLTFAWDLDDDGQFDDGTASTASYTYTTAGQHRARVRVTDVGGETDIASAFIQVDNTAPSVQILTPSASFHWKVDDLVNFSGSASDAQDGDLSAQIDWTLVLWHCAGATCHQHPLTSWDNTASGSFTAPDHEYPSYLELTASVTDTGGTTVSATRRLDPQTVDLTFASVPAGLLLTVGGQVPQATPFTRTFIVGSDNSISAPSPQSLNGNSYLFSSWSDGGAEAHQIFAPATATTYTATYVATASSCADTLPPVTGAGWQRNGTATVSGSAVQLTPATSYAAGTVIYATPLATSGLHVCFDAQIGGGTGADGMTLMLLNTSAGASALGANGSGLGYGGLSGIAVALDTYDSGVGDPSANFVGIATSGTAAALTYIATSTAIPTLEDAGPVPVEVSEAAGRLQVTVAGSLVLDTPVSLPANALLGFSAATGGETNQHLVSNVRVGTGGTPPPGNLVVVPTSLAYGSHAVGTSTDASVVLSNTGGSALTLSAVTLPSAPFSALAPVIAAGTVIPAGGSLTQVIRFSPTASGSFNGSLSVTPNTGQAAISVALSGSGVTASSCADTLPPVTGAGWQRNGTATVSGSAVQLTPAISRSAGTVIYATPLATSGLHVCFDAQIGGGSGSGAEGMTLMLLNTSAGASALGDNGAALGYGGLSGIAVALDTYDSGRGDPSDNFVGIATSGNRKGLTYIATSTDIPTLEGAGPVPVEVAVVNGRLQVTVAGSLVLNTPVSLPANALLGFSAATGGNTNQHLVSNVHAGY